MFPAKPNWANGEVVFEFDGTTTPTNQVAPISGSVGVWRASSGTFAQPSVSGTGAEQAAFAALATVAGTEASPGTLFTRYPANTYASSFTPCNVQAWRNAIGGQAKPYSRLYLSMRFAFGGPTFEANPSSTKLIFVNSGQPASVGNSANLLRFKGINGQVTAATQLELVFKHDITWLGPSGILDVPANKSTSQRMWTVGAWHHLEMVMELNAPGAANGVLKLWRDGVLLFDYANIEYTSQANGYLQGFNQYSFQPIWGGGGGTKNQTDHLFLDHVYAYGEP